MKIEERATKKLHQVVIEPVSENDYKKITKERYFFNWKKEKAFQVYKLRRIDNEDILGLVSFEIIDHEKWILIRLLSVSKENRGTKTKQYEHIAGNIIAFVSREAVRLFADEACVALEPKTELLKHYTTFYGMTVAGKRLALLSDSLTDLLKKYDL
jgi:hypothetical protein